MSPARDLVVTGIPRSGTTLTAALIDSLADAVCLSEPHWQDPWPRQATDVAAYVRQLKHDYARVRAELIAGHAVMDRRKRDGVAVSDYFHEQPGEPAPSASTYELVPFARPGLTADFLLGMKHNAHYTCVLEDLVSDPAFSVMALIRHPIPTILSWRSLSIPISEGRLPAAERLWPEILAIAADTDDVLLRQVKIYGLFLERYDRLRDALTLLRYEDLIAAPALLSARFERPYVRDVPILPRQHVADAADIPKIREYLQEYCPIAREYYPDLDRLS